MVTLTALAKAACKALNSNEIPVPLPDTHVIKLFECVAIELTWLYINLPCLSQTFANETLCQNLRLHEHMVEMFDATCRISHVLPGFEWCSELKSNLLWAIINLLDESPTILKETFLDFRLI